MVRALSDRAQIPVLDKPTSRLSEMGHAVMPGGDDKDDADATA